MAANMYRVGDYVYFETSSTSPFQIRRIEELNKTPSGNVEAKVMSFYRRRDIPSALIMLADKHQSALEEEQEEENGDMGHILESSKQRHQLKHRELFLSRQVENLPATHIRGKCTVTLLNETESFLSYLNKDDTFFYSLVFDPLQKTLLADKGEIRVGSRYQADTHTHPLLKEGESDGRNLEELETLVWTPNHNLTDRQIDQFLVISRSVGTFARALDCSSSVKQPSLHMSAAAASRDITLFHAMDTLHKHGYNIAEAISSLVPSTGPVLCRDEMEEWSASEANLFEEALEKYGKDFNDIRQDFLPWKTLTNIIEYYYMWKTTDRYVQQKRVKAVEAESKLKQVYIPNYNKPNPAAINNNKGVLNGSSNGDGAVSGKACESCCITISSQWYSWGPTHLQCRLCHSCWMYWKKYGGLKSPSRIGDNEMLLDVKKKTGTLPEEGERITSSHGSHRPHRCTIAGCGKEFKLKAYLARHCATAHGLAIRSGSPRPIMKTRTAFYLGTTPLTRISRTLCRNTLRIRHATRSPFWPINFAAIKTECQQRIAGMGPEELKALLKKAWKKDRGKVVDIGYRLGQTDQSKPEWLKLTPKDKLPKPEHEFFPKPPKGPDGSLIYERVPNKEVTVEKPSINNVSPSLLKRRAYEEINGLDDSEWDEAPMTKRPSRDMIGGMMRAPPELYTPIMGRSMINHLNGKAKAITMTRMGRKQVISWMDAPDDVYFQATEATRKMRKRLTLLELRRAAKKPCQAKIYEMKLN